MGMRQNEPFHLAYELDRGGYERRYEHFDTLRNSNYKTKQNNKLEEESEACCDCCCSLKMTCLVIGWIKIVLVLLFFSLIVINALITPEKREDELLYLSFLELTALAVLCWDLVVDIILLIGIYQKKIGLLNIFVGINGAFIILASFYLLKNIIFEGPTQLILSTVLGMSFLLTSIFVVQWYNKKLQKRSRQEPLHVPYEFTA